MPLAAFGPPRRPRVLASTRAHGLEVVRAALRKRVDDKFEAELPGGRRRFVVTGVDYPQGE